MLHVGPGGHEQAHDLGVRGAAVAEDDGLKQGRPTQVIDVVDVDRCAQEIPHYVDVTVVRRRDQAGASIAVGGAQVGAVCERQAQDFDTALGCRVEIWRVLDSVLGVDVGAGLDQRIGDADAVGVGSQ